MLSLSEAIYGRLHQVYTITSKAGYGIFGTLHVPSTSVVCVRYFRDLC